MPKKSLTIILNSLEEGSGITVGADNVTSLEALGMLEMAKEYILSLNRVKNEPDRLTEYADA